MYAQVRLPKTGGSYVGTPFKDSDGQVVGKITSERVEGDHVDVRIKFDDTDAGREAYRVACGEADRKKPGHSIGFGVDFIDDMTDPGESSIS